MHQHFYRELEQRLEGKAVVPQVFINGQHIGVRTCINSDIILVSYPDSFGMGILV